MPGNGHDEPELKLEVAPGQGDLGLAGGGRSARRALDQPDPDIHAARQGFRAALNHPDDIGGLIRLICNFRHVGFFRGIVQIGTFKMN